MRPTAGGGRHERADDRDESRQDHRLGPWRSKKRLRAVGVGLGEQPRVRPGEQPGTEPSADEVADLVAGDCGDEHAERRAARSGRPMTLRGDQRTGEEQERVAGQEEADEQPALGEDDRHDQQQSSRTEGVQQGRQGGDHELTLGART